MRVAAIIRRPWRQRSGTSLVEVMMAVAAGSVVLASAAGIFIYGLFSFAGMGNYAILTVQRRRSLDRMSQELREATQLVGVKQTGTT